MNDMINPKTNHDAVIRWASRIWRNQPSIEGMVKMPIEKEGKSVSIQASRLHYSLPREDKQYYTHYEVALNGFDVEQVEKLVGMFNERAGESGVGMEPMGSGYDSGVLLSYLPAHGVIVLVAHALGLSMKGYTNWNVAAAEVFEAARRHRDAQAVTA